MPLPEGSHLQLNGGAFGLAERCPETQNAVPASGALYFLLYAEGERPRKTAGLGRPLSLNPSPYDAVLLGTGMGQRLLVAMPMPAALLRLISLVLSEAGAETWHQMGIGLKGPRSRCCSALRRRMVGQTQLRGSTAEGCPLPVVGLAEIIARSLLPGGFNHSQLSFPWEKLSSLRSSAWPRPELHLRW